MDYPGKSNKKPEQVPSTLDYSQYVSWLNGSTVYWSHVQPPWQNWNLRF